MKHLGKLIIVVILLAFVTNTYSQVRFGPKVGLNISNVSQNLEESDYEMPTKMRMGYHFGVVVDIAFGDIVSFQPGLIYSSTGFSIDLEDDLAEDVEVDGYDRWIINYFGIPMNFNFGIAAGLKAYVGPYVGFGIGGKRKWDYTVSYGGDDYSYDGDYKFKAFFGEVGEGDLDDDEEPFHGLDFGANFGIGYLVGPVYITAGYSLGLGNLYPEFEGSESGRKDNKISNRVITFSVCYLFGGGGGGDNNRD